MAQPTGSAPVERGTRLTSSPYRKYTDTYERLRICSAPSRDFAATRRRRKAISWNRS